LLCLLCEILWSSSPSDSDIFVRNVRLGAERERLPEWFWHFVRNVRLGAEREREVSHQNFFLLVIQTGPPPASMLGVISPL
jgi:hypothetical protein